LLKESERHLKERDLREFDLILGDRFQKENKKN